MDDPGLKARIHVIPFRDGEFDETNWWHSKGGTLALIDGYFILGFHLFGGSDEPEPVERTDADFRRAFTRRRAE